MDANGLQFWMLADQGHWSLEGDSVQYDAARGTLRLPRHREVPDWPADLAAAQTALDRVPQTVDRYGTRAYWSPGDGAVMATGAAPGNVPLFSPPAADLVTDLALGYDDALYVAVAGRLTIVDPRERFQPQDVPAMAGFQPWRLAADPAGGVWALDAAHQKLARLRGSPFDSPRLVAIAQDGWPADERAVAIASSPDGRLAVLLWKTGEFARARLLGGGGTFGAPLSLAGSRTPFSLVWISNTQVALLLPGLSEAPVYTLDDPGPAFPPDGDFYPLRNHDGGPFLHRTTLPAGYPATDGARELFRLSLPAYTRNGSAVNALTLDSGRAATVWHRLYLEAGIPDHCGVVISLGAVNNSSDTPDAWYPHRFGGIFPADARTPRGAWVPAASEIPYTPGVLACPAVRNKAGLFTALIQRSGKRVRALRGRYLKVRVELLGNGLETPEIAALRAYASRFSYIDHYLPELYRENVFGAEADQDGGATPADFLERFVDNFEGVLTPLEDRIADSYLLTRSDTAPAEALDWLGAWVGVTYDSASNEAQRRRLLSAAPELFRRRGTRKGLGGALDIATDGAVSRGHIVILEDYRLRRTFATILGADLDDEADPLLAGIARSGNSFVGDTLFLGDEHRQEFLALFGASLPKSRSEANAVAAFFDGLAYRVTILVHQEIDAQNLGLVRRVAAIETPAHVAVRVERASDGFRAGVASLVGVDSYLAAKRAARPARVDVSYFGRGDLIERAPALDPRLGGEDLAARRPRAEVNGPGLAEAGASFTLNAGDSQAFEGRRIVKYIWTMLD